DNLRETISIVICVGCRGVISVGSLGAAVQSIIGKVSCLAPSVCEFRHVASYIVLVAFRLSQRVLAGCQPVHVAISVGREAAARVGHAEQVAIGIIGKRRYASERIGSLCKSV